MLSLKGFLGLDGSGWESGLRKAEKQSEKFMSGASKIFGGGFSGFVGAFAGGAFGGALSEGIGKLEEMLSRVQDKARDIKRGVAETGFDPQTYQRFANTLDATGSSGEAGARALEHIAEATEKIKKGEEGSGKLVQQFAALGVSLDDIKRKDYKQIFFQIADGMKEASLDAEKLTAIKDLLGKGGIEMLPAFKLGFDSSSSNRGVISDVDLEKLDQLRKLQKESTGWWKEMTNEAGLFWSKVLTLGEQAIGFVMEPLVGLEKEGKNEFRDMQRAKIADHDRQKAKDQAAKEAAAEKKKKDDEKAKKIREHFASQTESLDDQAAKDRFSLLTNEQKLKVLNDQAEVLRHMRGFAETDVLNGDATGEAANRLAGIDKMRAENDKARVEAIKDITKPDHVATHLNAWQEIGALVSFKPQMDALGKNTKALLDLADKITRQSGAGLTPPSDVRFQ